MNSFNLTLSGKHFICPSILNDSFAGKNNLGYRSLPLILQILLSSPFLPVRFLLTNQLIVLWALLCRQLSFPLASFRIVSLYLILDNLMMMCHCVFLFGSNSFVTLWASWTSWNSLSFTRLGKCSFIICSNKLSISCCCSSPSGTPIIQILECFRLSQKFVRVSSFFQILVSSF